ncbi:MAG TPA: hypothetical protein VFT99_25825 [Roseiflexaceae bacterium]|nr:hypothetical protein [Roseiflexaceae bacterium]
MQKRKFSWEAFFLTLLIVASVLFGSFYVLSWNYRIPIPWLVLLAISVVAAIALGRRPLRP